MTKDLDELKKEKGRVFRAMCDKLEETEVAEKLTESAEKTLKLARRERDAFQSELEEIEAAMKVSEKVWRDYEEYRDHINSKIEVKAVYLKREKRLIAECSDRARFAYENRDKNEAARYREEERKHERERDRISSDLFILQEKVKAARIAAEKQVPRPAEYGAVKAKLDSAEVRLAVAEMELERRKETSEIMRAEYNLLCKDYDVVRKTLDEALANQ